MILVDTSIWINLLRKNNKSDLKDISIEEFILCPPIIQEILQGISPRNEQFEIDFLSFKRIADPVELEDYLAAAELYRLGRIKGYSIRSSIDCLIAAIAIRNKLPIWHRDRDYDAISKFTSLEIFSPLH